MLVADVPDVRADLQVKNDSLAVKRAEAAVNDRIIALPFGRQARKAEEPVRLADAEVVHEGRADVDLLGKRDG